MKRRNVLYVIDSLREGGAESLLYYFLQAAISAPDFRFEVCTLYSGGSFEERIRSLGVPVTSLDFSRKYSMTGISRLGRQLNDSRYDLVHVHLFPASAYAALASLRHREPVYIFTEHSEFNRRRAWRALLYLDRLQYSRFSWVLAVGETAQAQLVAWLPELAGKTVVIRNAVPVHDIDAAGQQLRREYEQDIDVLFVGRLVEAKGVDVLLRALACAEKESSRPIRARLLGDGPLRDELQKLAGDLGLRDTEFVGIKDDVYVWMARSRILALPSRWEGLPMVLLESMAIGLPVISTAVGAIDSLIKNGESGFLVPVGDPDPLGSAIVRLLGDPTLRQAVAAAGYLTVEREYDISRMVEDILGFYRRILAKP